MCSLSFYVYSLYHYLLQHAWEYPTVEPDLEASRVEPLSLEAILSHLEPRRRIINLVPPEGSTSHLCKLQKVNAVGSQPPSLRLKKMERRCGRYNGVGGSIPTLRQSRSLGEPDGTWWKDW